MRRLAGLAACAAALLLAGCAHLPAPPSAPGAAAPLRLIGTVTLPPGTTYGGTPVGGLSGIDYDPAQDLYLLISDDRSTHAPARVYTARLRYTATQLAPPEFTGVHTLRHAGGRPFAPPARPEPGMDVPDPEAVRWRPATGHFLWTSEGDFARGFGPQLRESRADGSTVRDIALPAACQPAPGAGPRGNGTLEGLALMPGGRTAWLAMELPWRQDGPPATPASPGAPVRFTAIDVDSGQPLRQIAYQPDAVPHARRVPVGPQMNGVSEILADGPHHLLVLERAYSAGVGVSARLYRIDTREGQDTLALPALAAATAPKTLVADFAALGLAVDNLEGMAWGPPLPGGGCVLVFVSDDNFNPAQVTQFIAVQYLEPQGGQGRCGTTAASP
jgi:hypothetical protein